MDMSKMVAVKGQEGYFFDEDLNIWSFRKKQPYILKQFRRWSKGGSRNKHLRVHMNGKNVDVHRVTFETFNGPVPEGMIVRHYDDNELNNHPSNLVAGTPKDNALDAKRNGKKNTSRGVVLNEQKAREIITLSVHFTPLELAEFYGVSIFCIKDVLLGHTWKQVSREKLGFGQK